MKWWFRYYKLFGGRRASTILFYLWHDHKICFNEFDLFYKWRPPISLRFKKNCDFLYFQSPHREQDVTGSDEDTRDADYKMSKNRYILYPNDLSARDEVGTSCYLPLYPPPLCIRIFGNLIDPHLHSCHFLPWLSCDSNSLDSPPLVVPITMNFKQRR